MSASEQDGELYEEDRKLLGEILSAYDGALPLPERMSFRAAHASARVRLDELEKNGFLAYPFGRYQLTIRGLRALGSERAKVAYERCRELLAELKSAYLESQQRGWSPETFAARFHRSTHEVAGIVSLLMGTPGLNHHQVAKESGFVSLFSLRETILDTSLPAWPGEDEQNDARGEADFEPHIERIEISGYRPFASFSASLGPITVIIGANATGKSSLFDALRLLSYAVENPLPPEIDPRHTSGAALFHAGGPEQIDLAVVVPYAQDDHLRFEVSIQGPLGSPKVGRERLVTEANGEATQAPVVFLEFRQGKGTILARPGQAPVRTEWTAPPNELALRRTLDPTLVVASHFRAFVAAWRSYPGFDVGPKAAMRQPAYIDENPVLAEDGSNLTAVLNSLVLEHRDAWEELEMHLRAVIPSFESLGVRPRGARGMAIGTWREHGIKDELTLGDLSEGTLRLLCWLAVAFSPNLPPVLFIDEPELGLHPRVLPMLAGAFKLASARAQILIATHSPHFLSQFKLEDIAVMRKEDGRATFVRPVTSDALRHEVEALGGEAIAKLFLSEELEVLP